MSSSRKLAVVLMGEQNSGKSSAWYALFGDNIRTGKYERDLFLSKFNNANGDLIDGEVNLRVFVVNGSPEESGETLEDKMAEVNPRIVLTSVQYSQEGFKTIQYLQDNDFDIKVVWVNPGTNVDHSWPYADIQGLANRIIYHHGGELTLMPGGKGKNAHNSKLIALAVREKLLGWAAFNL